MFIKSFTTREDALIYPVNGEVFRYENGWPFLEVICNGQTVRLVNKSQILDMEIDLERTYNPASSRDGKTEDNGLGRGVDL